MVKTRYFSSEMLEAFNTKLTYQDWKIFPSSFSYPHSINILIPNRFHKVRLSCRKNAPRCRFRSLGQTFEHILHVLLKGIYFSWILGGATFIIPFLSHLFVALQLDILQHLGKLSSSFPMGSEVLCWTRQTVGELDSRHLDLFCLLIYKYRIPINIFEELALILRFPAMSRQPVFDRLLTIFSALTGSTILEILTTWMLSTALLSLSSSGEATFFAGSEMKFVFSVTLSLPVIFWYSSMTPLRILTWASVKVTPGMLSWFKQGMMGQRWVKDRWNRRARKWLLSKGDENWTLIRWRTTSVCM